LNLGPRGAQVGFIALRGVEGRVCAREREAATRLTCGVFVGSDDAGWVRGGAAALA